MAVQYVPGKTIIGLQLNGMDVKLSEYLTFETFGQVRKWICHTFGFTGTPDDYAMYIHRKSMHNNIIIPRIVTSHDQFSYPDVLFFMRNSRTQAIGLFYFDNDTKKAKLSAKSCCVIM